MNLDYDLGADAESLRRELRQLVEEHIHRTFSGRSRTITRPRGGAAVLRDDGRPGGCCAWPGRTSSEAAPRPHGSRRSFARRCGRTISPAAPSTGVNWVGPAIMRYGTPEQRRTHLPPIANGEVIWCQGFSEPNAGSDLASLQTSARRDGDGWHVTGQKVWTSYAGMAQWCFLLARTTKAEKKQQGITVFLVPMDDPAIEVRPIKSMIGPHHLNEVFIDNLWVTEADILGTLDEGWKLVQEVLAYERVGIARYARCERLLKAAPIVLGSQWDELPPELRSRWARMGVHCRRARLLAYRVVALQNSGRIRPADAAGYRIAVTRLDQESADVLMDIVGLARSIGGGRLRFTTSGGGPLALRTSGHGGLGEHRDAEDPARQTTVVRVMNLDLSDEALEYGQASLRALESAGGDRLVQIAEEEPERWEDLVAPVLKELGADELDPAADGDELEAAAALPQHGVLAIPYPVAGRLCRPRDLDAGGLVVVDGAPRACVPTGGSEEWVAVGLDGRRSWARALRSTEPVRRSSSSSNSTFVPSTAKGPVRCPSTGMRCWTLLGMLDHALDLTHAYVLERSQFGQPLASFRACSSSSPRPKSSAVASKSWPSSHCGASVRTLSEALAARWLSVSPPSRRPTSSSGWRTSCMAQRDSVTRRCCHGCRATASRCGGCRWAYFRHGSAWPVWSGGGLSGIFALDDVPYPFSEG